MNKITQQTNTHASVPYTPSENPREQDSRAGSPHTTEEELIALSNSMNPSLRVTDR